MGKRPHGIALIISNTEFEDPTSNRNGGKEDEDRIQALFNTLHYKVVPLNNLRGAQITRALKVVTQHPEGKLTTKQDREKLAVLSKKDCLVSAMHDSFVLCLMTHGVEGAVLGTDEEQCKIQEIHDIVGSCKDLSNKPKMVFIQACRGDNVLQRDAATNAEDLLISFATPHGFASYRDEYGSWYMQSICRIFNEGYKTKDLASMITEVKAAVMKKVGKEADGTTAKQSPVNEGPGLRFQVYFDLEYQSTS